MEYSYEDFLQKFTDTHIRFKDSGTVVTVLGPAAARMTFVVENDDGQPDSLLYSAAVLEKLDLTPPKVGNFNYRGYSLRLYRTPARQWKVGLCRSNHMVYNPLNQIMYDYTPIYKPVWNNALVAAMYNRDFPKSWKQMWEKFEDEKTRTLGITLNLSVSKNPNLANYRPALCSEPVLWYKHIPVGYLHGTKASVEDARYHQEVEDELHRWTN